MTLTCQNCLRALYPYIDRELSDEDIVQVKLHVDDCPSCGQCFHFHESLRRLVRVRCREQHAPAPLRERVLLVLKLERVREGPWREGTRE